MRRGHGERGGGPGGSGGGGGAAAKTSELGYYDQGPQKTLVQARWQAALAGASGLLAAPLACLVWE